MICRVIYVFQQTSQHMTLNNLGECCNQVNIQSDGPASVYQDSSLGDFKKYGTDSNVYINIMDSDNFMYKARDGRWKVCTKHKCRLTQ